MNITKTTTVLAVLAAMLNVAMLDANAQPLADSTGGTSQSHGEFALTPAGVAPVGSMHDAAPVDAALAHRGRFQPYPDSTGGSSAARIARVPGSPAASIDLASK